jgi:acetyl-CoA C-acetyltransferase
MEIMLMPRHRAAIVGIYEFTRRYAPDVSDFEIKAHSAIQALKDAGLALRDVDAVFDSAETGFGAGYEFPEYLGVRPSTLDMVDVGGASFEFLARHAAQLIESGKVRVALITYGSTAKSGGAKWGTSGGTKGVGDAPSVARNMEAPWGLNTVAAYALVANRHMYEYATTAEQLAEIAVTARHHALQNPEAVQGLRDIGFKSVRELTVDDVVTSPLIADPLHRLDCCLITDGGGAVVMARSDVAKDARTRPIWVLGSGEALGFAADGDITVSAVSVSAPAAFAEAGITPDEVDVAMIYDSFTITVLTILEDLGFCKKGEGGPFAAGGRLCFDTPGRPALNTDGGGLSSNHPGRRGLFLLVEAARQLRGESAAQVHDARLAVAAGCGGFLGTRHSAATIVLGRD